HGRGTVSAFEETAPKGDVDTIRATARLPRLNIAITHSRPQGGNGERIAIVIEATPSFDTFERFLQAANPYAYWLGVMRLAWLPWFGAARALTLPASTPTDPGRES